MRCSHDGSQPQPASMYATRRRGKRSNTPCTIIESIAHLRLVRVHDGVPLGEAS